MWRKISLYSTVKARFKGTRFRGKARFRGQTPLDDATVFNVRGKLDLEDKFLLKTQIFGGKYLQFIEKLKD